MAAVHAHRPAPHRDERTDAERPVQARDGSSSGSAPGSLEWCTASAKTEPSTVSRTVIYIYLFQNYLRCCRRPLFSVAGNRASHFRIMPFCHGSGSPSTSTVDGLHDVCR